VKIKEIGNKKDKELVKFINDLKAKLLKTSFDVRTKESNKVREIRAIKKDIARALTVKRERELTAEEKGADKEKK